MARSQAPTDLTVNGSVTASANITMGSISNLQVGGSLTMTAGTLTTQRGNGGTIGSINSGGTVSLEGSSVWSIGTVGTASGTVASGGTLDIGPSAIVNGSGSSDRRFRCQLKIGSADGIQHSTTLGNVRTSGTADSYSTGANYEYKGTRPRSRAAPFRCRQQPDDRQQLRRRDADQLPSDEWDSERPGKRDVPEDRYLGPDRRSRGSLQRGHHRLQWQHGRLPTDRSHHHRLERSGHPAPLDRSRRLLLIDVDVRDQAGTAPITVLSGTDGGNNGANWTFVAGCVADATKPYVVSIDRADANPTNASSVSWTVTFSESVTGVDDGDFDLVVSGLGGTPAITSVTGGGTTWTVTASTGTGDGTLGLDLDDDDTIVDAAGNALGDSSNGPNGDFSGEVYTIDRTAPAAPTITDSDPDSPANDNNPELKGTAEAGSTVRIYTSATCTTGLAATGSASAFASPGLTVTVLDDTTNSFYATATDAAGNVSACSSPAFVYVEDSTAPAAPTITDSDPDSPANDNNPELKGTAEAGSTVRIYTSATCTTGLAATGSASAFASPGLTVTVLDDTTNSFYATATDAAGNVSACSSPAFVYVEDSTAPAAPTITDSDPDSPANDNNPELKGTAEAGSTVRIYTSATCTTGLAATGSASAFASPGLTVTVLDDTTNSFYATATDAAGNVSACSSPAFVYVEDSTKPYVVSIDRADANPTNASSVSWTVTFSESVTGVDDGDFDLVVSGLGGTPAITSVTGGGTTWTVTASTGTGDGTLGLDLDDDDSIVDAAGNALGDSSNGPNGDFSGEVYTIDRTAPAAPTITDSDPDSPANDNNPELKGTAEAGSTVRIYTSATCTTGLAATGSASAFASPGLTVTVLDDTTNSFYATATDAAGNVSACSSPAFVYVEDSTAPAAPTITDSDPDSPANDNNPELKGTAEAGSTVRIYTSATCTTGLAATGSASAFASPGLTVTVLDDTTNSFYATATDAAGNVSACSSPAFVYVEDSTAPAAPTITDSDPDSPANDNNPELKGTAEAGSTVRIYTSATCTTGLAATGSASAFASPGLTVTVLDDTTNSFYATATDAAGNVSACSSPAFVYVEDSTKPYVVSIDRADANPTNASSVSWTVTFSESVTGVDDGDFDLVVSGLGGTPAITSVTGGGTTWTVTASTGTGDGTLGLDLDDDDSIVDAAGNALGDSSNGPNGDFSGEVYTIDRTKPYVVSIDRADANPTNASSVSWTVTFSESVTGVDDGDFDLVVSGLGGTPAITSVTGGGTTWTVTASTGTGDGTLGLDLDDDDSIVDAAGNALGDSSNGPNGDFSGEVYTIDRTKPYVVSIDRADANPTNASSVSWTVTFSESVTGVDDGDFDLVVSGLGGTPAITSVTGGGTTWTVTASTGTGDGTLGLDLDDDDSIVDAAGNALGDSSNGPNGDFSGEVYTIDRTKPYVVSIDRADANPTNASSVSWTVTFSESVTGVDDGDFDLVVSGLGGTPAITSVTGGGTTWTVTASTGTGDGTLGLDLDDDDSIVDAAGNALGDSSNGPNGDFSGEVYTIDRTKPYVVSIDRADANPTNASSVSWTVTFSESVTGVDDGDFDLVVSGLGGTPAITSVTGGGTTWTVTASTGTGDGTLGLDLDDDDSIVDAAGNALGDSSNGPNGDFSGEVYTIDRTAPAAPTITDSDPDSPANDNNPELKGTAEAGSTVRIYTSATCTTGLAATGSASAFASPGLTVTVLDDTTNSFYATATDAAGNVSACSSPAFVYVEDSTAPAAPTITDSDPDSPANDNNPELKGTAEAGSTVRIYTSATCTTGLAATGSASAFASPGLTVTVLDDTTNSFYATATDAAGNVSACSSPAFVYVEDSTAPAAPTITDSDPDSPANDNNPELKGTAEAGSTVRIYTSATCTTGLAATGSASAFASPGLTVTVLDDTTNSFYATATDAAGNVSACSSPAFVYVEDFDRPGGSDDHRQRPRFAGQRQQPRAEGHGRGRLDGPDLHERHLHHRPGGHRLGLGVRFAGSDGHRPRRHDQQLLCDRDRRGRQRVGLLEPGLRLRRGFDRPGHNDHRPRPHGRLHRLELERRLPDAVCRRLLRHGVGSQRDQLRPVQHPPRSR